jgi:hypothetical protein
MRTLLNLLIWLALAVLVFCAWGCLAWWVGIQVLGTSTTAKVAVTVASVLASLVMTLATFGALGLFLKPKG